MTQFKAKFEFDSQGPDELGFDSGEILTVLDTTTPGGWWKAQNSAGEQGYIPADYVEALDSNVERIPEPAFAPPPLPGIGNNNGAVNSNVNSEWGYTTEQYSSSNTQLQDDRNSWVSFPSAPDTYDNSAAPQTSGWDSDEFDDDDVIPSARNDVPQNDKFSVQLNSSSRSPSFTSSLSVPPSRPVPIKSAHSGGVSIKMSDYAKTGVGSFISGHMKLTNPPPSEAVEITISDGAVHWLSRSFQGEFYEILPGHSVGGKLGGLKKFVEYSISNRKNHVDVKRRYKQFDWLHEQLRNKFIAIAIPPLPQKQITGRYEEDFIELRKRGLQAWLSRVARHPVVGSSTVFQHFVNCTDLKTAWKQGKRAAEKSEWQGGKWLSAIIPPSSQFDSLNDREEVRSFEEYSEALSHAVRSMVDTQHLYSKKQSCVYKKDYQKIGQSFADFAGAFQKNSLPSMQILSRSTSQAAGVFEEISKLFGDQPDLDALPFIDALHEYKGMLSDGLPEVFGLAKSAANSVADVEKQGFEQKVSQEDVETCRSRLRTLNLAILAEKTHLCRQQEADFQQMFKQFIRAQITFYSNVSRKLEEALHLFSQND